MRNLNILMFVASWFVSAPDVLSQVSTVDLPTRRDDAIYLASEAHKLSKQVKTLTHLTNKTIAAQSSHARRLLSAADTEKRKSKFDLEVKESQDRANSDQSRRIVAAESQPVLQNYADLVARYHAALAAYLQHRKEVQQHAAAFHAAAQQQNSQPNQQPMMIVVPQMKQIEVQTQDACDALQQAEAGLHDLEVQLNQAVEMMMNNRKSLSAAQYGALWTASERRAAQLQSGANSFDQAVVTKHDTIQGNMHGKMQEAMRDGDYVLSQKVYGQQERSSALLHEEVKRATIHSQTAMMFLNRLQSLSPYASTQSSGGSGVSSDPNQFVQDDRELATEYAQVQALYQDVQEAAPKFHK